VGPFLFPPEELSAPHWGSESPAIVFLYIQHQIQSGYRICTHGDYNTVHKYILRVVTRFTDWLQYCTYVQSCYRIHKLITILYMYLFRLRDTHTAYSTVQYINTFQWQDTHTDWSTYIHSGFRRHIMQQQYINTFWLWDTHIEYNTYVSKSIPVTGYTYWQQYIDTFWLQETHTDYNTYCM
jgi:hypothetical protein